VGIVFNYYYVVFYKSIFNLKKQKIMFENAFSFDGRIRRTEYGISFIIYIVIIGVINAIIASSNGDAAFLGLAYIPLFWFLWAQGAKRCHDLDNNGWWQIIPFYGLWLLFQEGESGQNQYGANPKGLQNSYINSSIPPNATPAGNSESYNPGQYDGGHNAPNGQGNNQNYTTNGSSNASGEYNSGEMYK
jgi:uncharacterized membrane protein YhaH (DUF805 family)